MQGHTFLHMRVCRTVSIMARGHHNFILNGYLCVSLSDDRTGLFLYFSNMLVSSAPSPSWCHGVNGQDDSRFTRDYYPKMKGEEYTGQDMTSALCLYCVHRGQCWRGLCSMWSPRDPDYQRIHHPVVTPPGTHSPLWHHSKRKGCMNISHLCLCASAWVTCLSDPGF